MNQKDTENLLSFYKNKGRDLPWRNDPTPYHVWLSEIMLQQTRVETVKSYYLRFITYFPTIKSLAQSKEEECLILWQGLGYYSRVKNLRKAAIQIVSEYQGKLPFSPSELIKLPGIGEYTSKAIASMAYQQPYVSIDGNLLRIYARLTRCTQSIKNDKTKKEAELFFKQSLPKRPGDFNQALMDLGELICLPNGKPLCEQCPLASCCLSHQFHEEEKYPISEKKNIKKVINKIVFILEYQDKIVIEKREDQGLLASLYQLPNIEQALSVEKIEEYLSKQNYSFNQITYLGKTKHIFTHLVWNMDTYIVQLKMKPKKLLVSYNERKDYSIPTVFTKILSLYDRKKGS